nr:uncharacterized protein LOC131781419 [Pocillopora verrucosa]
MQCPMQASSIIKLNVGGHYFTTRLQTLTKDPNSMLAGMFSERFEEKLGEDGAFFIDRDGSHFRFILNYLRTEELTLPVGATFLEELKKEAEFYQIQGLIDEINKSMKGVVKLNVGGHYFTTSLQTLTKDPNSMLGTMFSGKYETRAGEDSAVFIDRDGTHFRFILNFLRTGKLTLPEGATALAEFKEEADFYQILGILDELDDTKLKSEILTDEGQQNLLLSWLPPHGDVRRRRLRLLFRASRDGFAANTFHDKCDNKGPTIVLVQSGNYVFGGFTEKSWMYSQGGYTICTQAFLFSLANPSGLEPTKLPLKSNSHQYAILYSSSNGPTFGCGCDLRIADDANTSPSSSSFLGHTYEIPPAWNNTSSLAGGRNFVVTNYEVFGFQP